MYSPVKILEPQIVKRQFNGKEKECIIVKIEGQEYEECERASQGENFWGNSKPGAYGAGLGATKDDKFKPARTGLLGQMAFGKLTGFPVDTTYRRGGDRQDNLVFGYKADMKCAMQRRDDVLIYHTNEWGKKIPLDKDIYVCAYVEQENRIDKNATIVMTGFALKKDVAECKVEPGRKGNGHLNYVVSVDTLRPITKLIQEVNKKLGTQLAETEKVYEK
jgi:hypothetical protein